MPAVQRVSPNFSVKLITDNCWRWAGSVLSLDFICLLLPGWGEGWGDTQPLYHTIPALPISKGSRGGDNECFHSLGYFESTRKLERETFLRSYHWNKICFKFLDDLDGKWDKDKSDTKYLLHFLLCTSLSISVLLFNVVCWDQIRRRSPDQIVVTPIMTTQYRQTGNTNQIQMLEIDIYYFIGFYYTV